MILAGDVGGTKTNLALFERDESNLVPVVEETFSSGDHSSLDEIALQFAQQHDLDADVACFGVAGPVRDGRAKTTNLPWTVDARKLASELSLPKVLVINDLEATAYALPALDDDDLCLLNPDAVDSAGNAAVIAAGTGLGEAGLFWDGSRHHPFACEGGHSDFAPRNQLEADLAVYLLSKFQHASWERVLSGPGLHTLYEFLVSREPERESSDIAEEIQSGDPAAVIGQAALDGKCPLCGEALDLFVSLYGAEAGNLALKLMAVGGLYVGGGIAPRILPKLQEGEFVKAFAAKGRLRSVLESIPVRVILTDRAALIGAARCGLLHADE